MQVELKIKEILGERISNEKKVEEISKVMNWDKKKLMDAITKYKTSNNEGMSAIIKQFWGNAKR